jgi:aminopeptidase N
MESLIHAMKWDENRFGLEYDLDFYHVVVTNDFNMGAVENKSLNIFNSKYVLARPETATDIDYQGIEGVIGHEYFHNWTGNRVTCRDWFQLTLKEGLPCSTTRSSRRTCSRVRSSASATCGRCGAASSRRIRGRCRTRYGLTIIWKSTIFTR